MGMENASRSDDIRPIRRDVQWGRYIYIYIYAIIETGKIYEPKWRMRNQTVDESLLISGYKNEKRVWGNDNLLFQWQTEFKSTSICYCLFHNWRLMLFFFFHFCTLYKCVFYAFVIEKRLIIWCQQIKLMVF